MKSVLIINLRRLGDVYSTSHLINSLHASGYTNITLLSYKENNKASRNIKNIKKIVEIDRKEIVTLMKNKLFCSAFAFESLLGTLGELKDQSWDHVINYSNDSVSTYITSFLQSSTTKITGMYFNQTRKVKSENDWGLLFNDILPGIKHSPIHFVDCYHHMANIELVKEGDKVITSPKFNQHAFLQISKVRSQSSKFPQDSKVVALQLKSSQVSKDIPLETLVETIAYIRQTPSLIPVLLIAPTEDERSLAQEINQRFDNDLVVIETSLNSLASVLINIDLLVTPDTVVKHLADLTETPTLEVSLGSSPFFKQGTYSREGLVLTDLISERDYTSSQKTNVTALDINLSILYALSQTRHVNPILSEGVTLYKTRFDQHGMAYQPIAGSIDSSLEIHRQLSRVVILNLLNKESQIVTELDFNKLNQKEVSNWIVEEKLIITSVLRDILATIRDLYLCKEKKSSAAGLVANIDRIFNHTTTESIIQIPLKLFKLKIDQLDQESESENISSFEALLFELKDDIQQIIGYLIQAEKEVSALKIKTMIKKVNIQPQI